MKIAIVDDAAAERVRLRADLVRELKEREICAEIEEFESGEEFLEVFSPGVFSVVFLDIFMKELTGIEVGERLYEKDSKCRIIFLTSSEEYMLESYRVRATYYLVKPYELQRLQQALDFCFPRESEDELLKVRLKEGTLTIPKREVLYVAAKGRYSQIHTEEQIIDSKSTFSDVVHMLAGDSRFFCCYKGVLVNFAKVAAQRDNDFIMMDGQVVPISKRVKTEALGMYHDFLFLSMRNDK